MVQDKYTAVWVSHSSITDFLQCPRAYFLKNVYKDPVTGRKISLTSPALALGQAVHEVLESLSVLPLAARFDEPLLERFERVWQKVSGEKGGFESKAHEAGFKKRGEAMIRRVVQSPGPLKRLAVKIKEELPYFWLSEADNLILCGKIDWLEYLEKTNRVHIIDFKSGRGVQGKESLQLPIYHLLAKNCQSRRVAGASYWYLDRSDAPAKQKLPDLEESFQKVLKIAKKIKLMRQLEKFDCPSGSEGCRYCRPFEKILLGKAVLVGINDYGQNTYVLKESASSQSPASEIL